ncbi:putative bifunctional transcriptional activator/DNA repair enzyme AlkA [Alteripontixanthobacter maritimus]|uniref:methylated-DNA--[protein]-cysteine S-methyltransferase n=1 Tax=Alteripontixanthobacter maritimus TaxID=2161824 RepID=A0A369Q4Z9_9SPHN|nr:methylated-DNA--[protein]-cysteine S-methyltransferase [Alteripontixanthobacter maritimus]RDC59552.1 putative bifunctional transcriptional activator/DNA repair enzyme AlkA [Alteripontixanthobacter maritimus]
MQSPDVIKPGGTGFPPSDEAWEAVQRRDRAYDGRFVTGVLSTGIYCRPSCAARHPARRNVRFFDSAEAARACGLRACKRCLPDDVARDEAAIRTALTLLRRSDAPVSLTMLAERTGYSPTHFQRVFRRAIGLSPAAYRKALQRERTERALGEAASVTEAIYAAGFSTPSRFYDARKDNAMAASAWINGGAGVTIRWGVADTTLGPMLVAATDKGVCRLSFGEGPEELARRFPNAELAEGGDAFTRLLSEVVGQVEEPGHARDIPLDIRGTAFQEAVWKALRQIPAGETRSYSQIAAEVGRPKAVRAAGSANGANHVAVLIPCHRVIAADGGMGGYAYGLDIKRALLEREAETTT